MPVIASLLSMMRSRPADGRAKPAAGSAPAALQRRATGLVLLVCGLFIAFGAAGRSVTVGALTIGHPFALETPPGARIGGAYFTIVNAGRVADRLIAVSSPAAGSAALHSMEMDGTVMKMRALPSLAVPPGGTVTLAPGGYHVMLHDLSRPLVDGETLPLRLTFEKGGTIDVVADVEKTMPAHAHR